MVRKLWLLALALSVAGSAHAFMPQVWKSSTTATADTTKSLCASSHAFLHGVRVNDGGSGLVTIYDSRGAASGTFAIIRSTGVLVAGGVDYDVQLSSGLTYTTSAAGTNVTILYQCW